MENVCSILVYMDSFYVLTVNISRNVIPAVDHKAALSLLSQFVSHDCSVKTGSHDKIIIFFHLFSLLFCTGACLSGIRHPRCFLCIFISITFFLLCFPGGILFS